MRFWISTEVVYLQRWHGISIEVVYLQSWHGISTEVVYLQSWHGISTEVVYLQRWHGISTEVVYLQRWHGWCHVKVLPSRRVLCTPYNHAPYHFIQSHISKLHVCLVVTCHLYFWQNSRIYGPPLYILVRCRQTDLKKKRRRKNKQNKNVFMYLYTSTPFWYTLAGYHHQIWVSVWHFSERKK